MKMRIQGNAIRLRLNRREVSEFEAMGTCGSALEFPGGGRLNYILETGAAARLGAEFDGASIRITVPESVAHDWTRTDQVGIHERRTLDGGEVLEILIEKDFQCMHKGDEAKDSEAYPNPMATQSA